MRNVAKMPKNARSSNTQVFIQLLVIGLMAAGYFSFMFTISTSYIQDVRLNTYEMGLLA